MTMQSISYRSLLGFCFVHVLPHTVLDTLEQQCYRPLVGFLFCSSQPTNKCNNPRFSNITVPLWSFYLFHSQDALFDIDYMTLLPSPNEVLFFSYMFRIYDKANDYEYALPSPNGVFLSY